MSSFEDTPLYRSIAADLGREREPADTPVLASDSSDALDTLSVEQALPAAEALDTPSVEQALPAAEAVDTLGAERASSVGEWSIRPDAESRRGVEVFSGTVSRYDKEKGFGLIRRDDGAEFFVHVSALLGDGYRYLLKDEPVEFELGFDDQRQRLHATRVWPPAHRKKGFIASWDNARGIGRIKPDDPSDPKLLFVHHSAILGRAPRGRTMAVEDELVEYEVEVDERGRTVAQRVKRLDSRLPLFKFANMGYDEKWLEELAKKAEDEVWDYTNTNNPTSRPVLRSYLAYTFARLKDESDASEERDKKICYGQDPDTGRRAACFNTGLVTPNQEPIFALFTSQNPDQDGCEWKYTGFHAKSDRAMLGKFGRLPEMANYFDDPSELIYDRKRELVIDVDHIVDDRIDRFPAEVRNAADPKGFARNLLQSAHERAVARVNRNYKTAIPHYYQGSIQLLLPLCLTNASKAELALTVTRHGEQYRGGTVLHLYQAYNNARLITKPDTEWLQP